MLSQRNFLQRRLPGDIPMKMIAFGAVLFAALLSSSAHADVSNTGWYFSRANCLTMNESITWKGLPGVSIGMTVIPTQGGFPALRRTISYHSFKYDSRRNHRVESGPSLELTWRSHAGHFPRPESFPHVSVVWLRLVVPIFDSGNIMPNNPNDLEDSPFFKVIYVSFVKVDPKPWIVSGTHYERTDLVVVTRYSSATGCNWGHTFRSM